MATFVAGETMFWWTSPTYTIQGTLTGNVTRRDNKVTLSGLSLSLSSAYTLSGPDTIYIEIGGVRTSFYADWGSGKRSIGPFSLNNVEINVSASATSTSVTWKTSDNYSNSFSIQFISNVTGSNVVPATDSFTATVAVTGWGGSGDANTRYRELQCWTYNASSLVEPRRYQPIYGNTLSGPITVSNSSLASSTPLTITPNTRYTIGVYANNGSQGTGSQRVGNYATLAPKDTLTVAAEHSDSLDINYSVPADGGYNTKTLEYSIDGGTTWTTYATISSGSATTGSFTISGLQANTNYTIKSRVTTASGTTNNDDITGHTTGPNVPTISISSRTATIIGLRFSESAFNSTTGRSLYVRGGTTNPPTTTITTQSSPQDGTEYSFLHTNLSSNTKYYYQSVAQATFSGSTVATASDVISAITYSPVPTISSVTWVEFPTASTQKYNFSVSVPADGGELSKDIQYRVQVDGTWTSWTTFSTVSSGSATTVNGNFTVTNNSAEEKTGTLQVRTHTSSFNTGTNSSTFTIKAKAGAPAVDSWQLIDNNPDTVAITGSNTVFIAGYSVPKISVAQSAIHLADGATIAQIKGTFDGLTQSLTLSSGTYSAYFANPTAGSRTGTLYIKDSLDGDVTKTLTRTVLAYSTPTITGSYVRSGLDGEVDLSLGGTYSPLTVGGNEKNELTVSYKLSSSGGTITDWTELQVTKGGGAFTALVQNLPTDYSDDYLVEFKIEDSLQTATGSLVVTAINYNDVLRTPQYDIEVWTRDGNFVADISKYLASDLSISWKLNDIEELSFDISMDAMELLSEAGTQALLTPYAHDIRVRRNGRYIVGCQVIEANLKINNDQIPTIQVKATGFLNIFKDQYISEPLAGYTYPEMAHKLINRAQHADCLIKNPTGDIDASYWLSPVGAVAQTVIVKAGAGAIQCSASSGTSTGLGTEMNVKAGTPIHLDVWVSGKAGSVYVRERELITQSSNQGSVATFTLTADNTYTHFTADYTTIFNNGYLYIEQDQIGTPIRVDNCFVSRTDDEDSLNNHYIGSIYVGLDDTTGGTGHNYATTGYVSDREFNYELQNVKDAIMDLVEMGEDQFDFEFTPDRIFNTYERKGADKPNLPITYPGNVHTLNVTRSASDVANKIQNIGSGIGDERLEALATDLDSRQIYGTRESVITNNNVSLEDTLQGQVDGELIVRKEPSRKISVTIQDGSINCANVETGDVLPFKIEVYKGVLHQQIGGENTPTNFLKSVEGLYEVKSISVRVGQDRVESTSLTLEYLEPFPEPPTPDEGFGQISYYVNDTDRKIVKLQSANDVNQLYFTEGTHESATIDGQTIPINSIYSVKLTSDVESLPANFLSNDTKLEKVDISETSITAIPDYFLSGCTNFNSKFKMPRTVTSIGNYFLYGDTSFNQKIVLPNLSGTALGQHFMRECTSFNQELEIPPLLTAIRSYFLAGCSSFNQPLELPVGLRTIYGYFLYQCSSFNQPIEIPSRVNYIETYFMADCQNFNYPVVIPSGVTRIYAHFLRDCLKFNSPITIPSGVTRIDGGFLRNCMVFNQPVEIPAGVTIIGSEFLYNCKEYNYPIDVPSGLTSIENNFLSGCEKFNYPITIPSGVTIIKDSFLYNCKVYDYPITVPNTTTSIGNNFMCYCYAFNSSLTLSTNLTSIGNAFLRSAQHFNQPLTIPSNITSIGTYFLYDARVFNQAITIPSGLTAIKDGFLAYNYKLNQAITFPTNATTIGGSVLRSCSVLNQPVTLSPNTTSIGNYFMDSSSAFNRNFTIPNSVTSIGDYFFGRQRQMRSNIIVGTVNASVATASNYTLGAYSAGQPAYTTGISIKGSARSSWLTRFPNRTADPYRKLKDGGA